MEIQSGGDNVETLLRCAAVTAFECMSRFFKIVPNAHLKHRVVVILEVESLNPSVYADISSGYHCVHVVKEFRITP